MRRSERRQGNTTQQKDKATQHNSPKAVNKEKTASGGIRTHSHSLARRTLLPTELPRQLSWLGLNHMKKTYLVGSHKQYKRSLDSAVSSLLALISRHVHVQYKATKAPQPKHHKPDKQVNSYMYVHVHRSWYQF